MIVMPHRRSVVFTILNEIREICVCVCWFLLFIRIRINLELSQDYHGRKSIDSSSTLMKDTESLSQTTETLLSEAFSDDPNHQEPIPTQSFEARVEHVMGRIEASNVNTHRRSLRYHHRRFPSDSQSVSIMKPVDQNIFKAFGGKLKTQNTTGQTVLGVGETTKLLKLVRSDAPNAPLQYSSNHADDTSSPRFGSDSTSTTIPSHQTSPATDAGQFSLSFFTFFICASLSC